MKSQATKNRNYQPGLVHWSTIIVIVLSVLFAGAGAFGIWAYLQYTNARSDVDGQIEVAVSAAEKEQAEKLHNEFLEEEKKPNYTFTGPEDYASVSFMYPKTWSVYVDKDGTDRGDYRAFLHPTTVPSLSNDASRFAFRVEILNKNLDDVLNTYQAKLKKGELTSSSVEANGIAATRLDGTFDKDLRGAAILFKLRDKTVRLSTDADTFKPDFQTILNTIKVSE